MKKVAIIYGSTTGNTEQVASLLAGHLSQYQVTLLNVAEVSADLVEASDLVLLGSSTWGYGEIQDDFADYMPQITPGLYSGKAVAVFGCGDSISFGDVFCEAVTQIEAQLGAVGANLVQEGLRVDGDVDANLEAIENFAQTL